ncbi:unnamed protein product [Protopolystoma xenopodis]|uniref:Uncharacterized protein n=1 Tax=Protopolystoma xenopodis TaxID=117903 RepID=A0A448WQQ8_9PLAT|nr:unnamed protein product [Protopolystoma xenopodis]
MSKASNILPQVQPTTGPDGLISTGVYEAGATAAGLLLDLPAPFVNAPAGRRTLKIVRSYQSDSGQTYTRTELVAWSSVVEIYLKIRQTRDDDFIQQFVGSDDQIREQQRREKRRIQVKCICLHFYLLTIYGSLSRILSQ